MKTDLYTKIILTIIALALVIMAILSIVIIRGLFHVNEQGAMVGLTAGNLLLI